MASQQVASRNVRFLARFVLRIVDCTCNTTFESGFVSEYLSVLSPPKRKFVVADFFPLDDSYVIFLIFLIHV